MNSNRKPAALGKGQTGLITDSNIKHSTKQKVKEGTKEHVILSVLVDGQSLTRFDAIPLHDTCLNSTISTLQSKGLRIHRVSVKVPCVNNTKKIDVMRYSLTADQLPKARELLGMAAI